MHKVWIGCATSNFRRARAGYTPEAIVLHRGINSQLQIDSRCNRTNSFCSSHYSVGINGEVHQYVEEADTAFHAGIVVAPVWQSLKPGKNPNLYTIGVEFESNGHDSLPPAQSDAAAGLIAGISRHWKFPLDEQHLVLHEEIRAGVHCPDTSLDRAGLLQASVTSARAFTAAFSVSDQITVMVNAAIREAPVTTSRIIRIAAVGSCEPVIDFDDQGERIKGNSCWYATADGYFVWAGATDRPNPVTTVRPPLKPAVGEDLPVAETATCHIAALKKLLQGGQVTPIGANSDKAAVGAVQDLLAGHGLPGLPTIFSNQYGTWTPKTTAALQSFQQDNGLNVADSVDGRTLRALTTTSAVDPRASEAYLEMVLGVPVGGLAKVLTLVAQMEGAGKFGAINPNSDHAGLSFGLIQWAQKPGRLADLLTAMCVADQVAFASFFGAGDSAAANALLDHCRKPSGGVDPSTGVSTNPAYSLIQEAWLERFRACALAKQFQAVQVQSALKAFSDSYVRIRQFATGIRTERGIALLVDIANQFGNGGAAKLYNLAYRSGMSEADLLDTLADETVARMPDPLKAGVRARREQFLHTSLLSDGAFQADTSEQQNVRLATA